eukprot:1111740-Pleurochrysis_carterae.AAC.1
MSCNTTCYKRETCNTKWHYVANFGVPAKAMKNMRSKFKVADIYPTHQRLFFEAQSCIHLFVNTRPTAPKVATRSRLVLQSEGARHQQQLWRCTKSCARLAPALRVLADRSSRRRPR